MEKLIDKLREIAEALTEKAPERDAIAVEAEEPRDRLRPGLGRK